MSYNDGPFLDSLDEGIWHCICSRRGWSECSHDDVTVLTTTISNDDGDCARCVFLWDEDLHEWVGPLGDDEIKRYGIVIYRGKLSADCVWSQLRRKA